MKKRAFYTALFPLLQIATGGVSFLAWAWLSHQVPLNQYSAMQIAVAWGSALFLPLSLGLPFVLANFSRTQGDIGRFAIALRLVVGTAGVAAIVGGLLVLLPSDGSQLTVGLTVIIASLISLSTLLQQIGRLRWSLPWMLSGVVGSLALPFAAAVWVGGGGARNQTLVATAAMLALVAACTCGAVIVALRETFATKAKRTDIGSALHLSLPLIPHLLAFGLLMQGPRLAVSLVPNTEEEVLNAAYLMQFMGIGFAVVASLHGLASTSIQRSSDAEYAARRPHFAAYYGAIGAFSAAATVGALYSPITRLFSGFTTPDPIVLVAVAACFGSLALYYYSSAVIIRLGRTRLLPSVSVPIVTLYLLICLGAALGNLSFLMVAMACSLAALATAATAIQVFLQRRTARRNPVALAASLSAAFVPTVAIASGYFLITLIQPALS